MRFLIIFTALMSTACLEIDRGEYPCTSDSDCPSSLGCEATFCGGPAAGFVELIAGDPIRDGFDFFSAEFGGVIEESEVRNAGKHIVWNSYFEGELSVGIQGGEHGAIVDLGTDDEVADALGVENTVGGGRGFAALAWSGGEDGGLNEGLPAAADALALNALDPDSDSADHIAPVEGNVYAMRVRDRFDGDLDLVVKLFVTTINDGDVGIQWARLRGIRPK